MTTKKRTPSGFLAVAMAAALSNSVYHPTPLYFNYRENPLPERNKLKGLDRHGMPKRRKKMGK